jgi:hypothetical protein
LPACLSASLLQAALGLLPGAGGVHATVALGIVADGPCMLGR